MNRLSLSSLLTALLLVSLIMVSAVRFGTAQTSGTSVSGIIATDTTWTRANSPYTLIGNILVNTGATLTIQSGTTINLGSYYLMVNGTLQAIGTIDNPVILNGSQNYYSASNAGEIIFTPNCNGWTSNTVSGCIIQNAIVNSPLILSNAVEITQDKINNGINVQSQISSLQTGTPTISNNLIKGGITIGSALGSAIITDNTIVGSGISFGSMNPPNVTVAVNTIVGCGGAAINVGCWGLGMNNQVQLIVDNLIVNNSQGIVLADWEGGSYPIIENNTIANNTIGICVSYPWGNNKPQLNATILYNNIGGNSKYDFQNQQPTTVNATYNWWGTTDTQAISLVIYDYYDDFNIGQVIYSPFLTTANIQAPTYTPPPPTSNTTVTPTPTLQPTPSNLTTSPTASPIPIQTPQGETLHATTDKGAIIDIPISGNITTSQMSNVIIATNQSATTTVLSFTLTGQSGTGGFSNMTIPKNEVPYGKIPVIFVDDQQVPTQGYTQNADNYYVWYTTHFSSHQVTIEFITFSNTAPKQINSESNLVDVLYGVGTGVAISAIIVAALILITKSRRANVS
jgi:parallel beta-helix repeat protein